VYVGGDVIAKLTCQDMLFCSLLDLGMMRHGVDVISPSSWKPQEKGMMSIEANFPSVRNQGLSVQEKAKRLKVMLASLVTSNKGAVYDSCRCIFN
jgi:hypothetical protein